MDLSIIIVSWNVEKLLKKNLEALYKSEGDFSFEVFVVDNKSADDTVKMVSRDFPQVNLIANNYNAGFAAANNQAMEMSSGKYILLLNPDMEVKSDTLLKMLEFMKENSEAGISSCKLVDGEGKIIEHARNFPRFFDQLMIVLKVPHLFPGVLNRYLNKGFDYNKKAEVDSVRGAFFMIRRELFEAIGKLDERYFIWFEEVDYCLRAVKAGSKVMYNPEAVCIDYIGKSFSQVKRGKTQKYFRDSMIKYFKKWGSFWEVIVLYLAWPIGMAIAYIYSKIKKLV